MAMSLSNFLTTSLLLLVQFLTVNADTVTLDWNITWTTANPAGQEARPVIGINNQWPPPVLNVTKGDRIVAHVTNLLGNQSTSIHWHGFFQNGTNHMDGPQGVTQCGISPNSTFTYNFTVEQSGTYWYHSHTRAQYPDGLRQALIIADPDMPYLGQYDEERIITLSDWYNDQMPGLMKAFINVANPTGAEPVPNAALMNDTQNFTLSVEPGKTYLLHLINVGAFAGQYFWIEGHQMKIVEVDGVYTEEAEADMIYLTTAQRYGVLVTMKNETSSNFAMQASMDTDLFDTLPDTLNWNVTGWLVYDTAASLPVAAEVETFLPFDDFTLVPTDGLELYGTVDQTITLNLTMNNLGDGANYAFFNDITYVSPKVPTLYTVMSTGDDANNPVIYGTDTNAFILEKDQVVEIVLNNEDSGKHPFHLHGHNFQAIVRSEDDAGFYDVNNHSAFPAVPMRRDTFMTRPNSNFVIRFKSTNPGVWIFHCHIQWHMDSGLLVNLIEAPLELQKTLSIPQDHFDACKVSNTPTAGNAAGNTEDHFDLHGENRSVAPLPAGFTARGIVALVFSCIAAFLGMAAISWYGAAPLGSQELESVQRRVAEANVQD